MTQITTEQPHRYQAEFGDEGDRTPSVTWTIRATDYPTALKSAAHWAFEQGMRVLSLKPVQEDS